MGVTLISLSDDLQSIVDREVSAGEFATDADFIEQLIREHHTRRADALVTLLRKADGSGDATQTFDQIIDEARGQSRSA